MFWPWAKGARGRGRWSLGPRSQGAKGRARRGLGPWALEPGPAQRGPGLSLGLGPVLAGPGPKTHFGAEDGLDGDFCVDSAAVVTYFYPNNSPGDEILQIQKTIFGPSPAGATSPPPPQIKACCCLLVVPSLIVPHPGGRGVCGTLLNPAPSPPLTLSPTYPTLNSTG